MRIHSIAEDKVITVINILVEKRFEKKGFAPLPSSRKKVVLLIVEIKAEITIVVVRNNSSQQHSK